MLYLYVAYKFCFLYLIKITNPSHQYEFICNKYFFFIISATGFGFVVKHNNKFVGISGVNNF
jgi:hypothetical protein